MSTDTLLGPILKIRRAQHHLVELEKIIESFVREGACSVQVEETPATGEHILKVVASKPLPEDIPLIIGDTANNLRSALDILVSGFIREAGGNIKRGSLITRETKQKLVDDLKKSEIHKVRPDVAEFILKEVKPHKEGNYEVWGLGELDNINKHRLIIPVVVVTSLSGISARDDSNNVFRNLTVTVQHGRIANLIQSKTRMHITDPGSPDITILFDRGYPFEGKEVLPTLRDLVVVVSSIVESFRVFAPQILDS